MPTVSPQAELRLQRLDEFGFDRTGCVLLAIFLLAAVFWSLGDLFLLTRYLTQASGRAPNHARGRYLAVFGLSGSIGTVVAPLTVTKLLTSAGVAVVLAILQPWFRERLISS